MRLGWQLQNAQTNPENGVSVQRFAHAAARMLLDWETTAVKSVPNGDKILHGFSPLWTPYRYGAIISSPFPEGIRDRLERPPLHRMFLEDLVQHEDMFFGCNVIRLPGKAGSSESATHVGAILMPYKTAYEWTRLFETTELSIVDRDVVDDLSTIYAKLQNVELQAISSCPREDLTKISIAAEVQLWHWDFGRFLDIVNHSPVGSTYRAASEIVRKATACASEINEKVEYSQRITEIRDVSLLRAPASLIREALRNSLELQNAHAFDREIAAWRMLHSLSIVAGQALETVGDLRVFSEGKSKDRRIEAHNSLKEIGVSEEQISKIDQLSRQVGGSYLGVAKEIEDIYRNLVSPRLRELGLPSSFTLAWWDDAIL